MKKGKIFFTGFMALLLLGMGLPAYLSDPLPDNFFDDFDSPALDPAWQVVEYLGPFVYNYPPPANFYSLTENPGFLRYSLTAMTHYDGFMNGYQITDRFHSGYYHHPGLELHRLFSGNDWVFETKVSYHMPFCNGRNFSVRIYFGDGGMDTYYVALEYWRDVNQNHIRFRLAHQYGPSMDDSEQINIISDYYDIYGPADMTRHLRVTRENNILKTEYSYDGNLWTTAYATDMGNLLDGLQQRVVITGLSWFLPSGSYADYDYVKLTPNAISSSINIDPDTLNLKSKGRWITAYVGLPEGYDVNEIDGSTVELSVSGETPVPADRGEVQGSLFMVKFDRDAVKNLVSPGDVELNITGNLEDGKRFKGSDTIRVR